MPDAVAPVILVPDPTATAGPLHLSTCPAEGRKAVDVSRSGGIEKPTAGRRWITSGRSHRQCPVGLPQRRQAWFQP